MSSDWCSYRLGDLTTFKYGKFLAKSQLAGEGFPVFSGYGVVGYLPEYQFEAPQLLMVCRGEGGTGDVKMSPPKCSITNLSIVFSVNETMVTKKFLYWALKARNTRLLRTGSAQAQIVIGSLENFRVEIPAQQSEQITIAGFLDSLDGRIALLNETNATLEAIAKALFKSWFVDFDPVRAKMEGRAPEGMDEATAALFPDSFEESELGLVPRGWSVGTVEDVCQTITNGGTPSRSNKTYWEGGEIPWFKTGDFSDGFLLSPTERITQTALECSAAKLLSENAVLMAIYAAPTVGRLGILSEPAAFNQACTGMVAHKNIGPWFLYWTLYFGRDWFNNRANGAAQQNISKAIVAGYKIVVPSDDVLAAFNDVVAPIHAKIRANSEQAKELGDLRDTLLPRLISGQLRLTASG